MTARRATLIALGAGTLFSALPAFAQQPSRVRRIAFVSITDQNYSVLAAFREGMTKLRWVEGRDYVLESYFAKGDAKVHARLAAEQVASRPDLLLTGGGGQSTRVLAQLTRSIPIVFVHAVDPIGLGVAESLRRPGGNVTGLTNQSRELSAKRLQLLKEAFPRVAHVAVLFEATVGPPQVKEIEQASSSLGVRVSPIELRQAADIEPAFKRGAALGAQAWLVASGPLTALHGRAMADGLLRLKVPAMFSASDNTEEGGLMSYAVSYADNYRRAAAYADKILKGAKPGELPIEQPSRFELLVNLKTAKAMGLAIPQSILLRADRVIE